MFLHRLGQHPLESFVVGFLLKKRQAGHRAVQHVVDESPRGVSGDAWHADSLHRPVAPCKRKELRPLFTPERKRSRNSARSRGCTVGMSTVQWVCEVERPAEACPIQVVVDCLEYGAFQGRDRMLDFPVEETDVHDQRQHRHRQEKTSCVPFSLLFCQYRTCPVFPAFGLQMDACWLFFSEWTNFPSEGNASYVKVGLPNFLHRLRVGSSRRKDQERYPLKPLNNNPVRKNLA
jgi:hypothetical protein